MLTARKFATLMAAGAICLPVAACGEDDVDQARKDVQEQANELRGNIDDLSKHDLREALNDAQEAAKSGGEDTKREARELERKIERELEGRE